MTPARETRADLVLRAREALGMTQRELGALLRVPTSTVGRWEAGIRDPGAVGEALARLILDSPKRATRVLGASPAPRKS